MMCRNMPEMAQAETPSGTSCRLRIDRDDERRT